MSAMNIFENLNKQQIEAVKQIDGAMLILAGAGSGKTMVLMRRIIYMLEQNIAPYHILAITFSHRAAEELKGRIIKNVPDNCGRDIKVKTFHALCAEILRNEKTALGNYIFHREIPNFVICNMDDCILAMREAIEENNFTGFPGITAEGILDRINKIKNEGITVEMVKAQWMKTQNYVDDVFLKLYSEYQLILQRNFCMDFNDLILYVLELFEKFPNILEKYQERYRYIMIDEYQDTNHLQYKLIQMLAGKNHNLCVVGDDDQSIYGFRGADVNNIFNFKNDYPDATVIKLEQNYRSSAYIVDIANSIIRNNKNRFEKKMKSNLKDETVLHIAREKNAVTEAELIAKSITMFHKQGIPYNEIAVIYRVNGISKEIQQELTLRGIPYRIAYGIGLLDHKETKDIMAFLRLIHNSNDDISFKRIINVPTKRIPDRAMDTLTAFARKNQISLFTALKRGKEIWHMEMPCEHSSFIRMIEYLQQEAKSMTIPELIDEVLDKTGYEDFVLKNYEKYTMQYIFDMIEFAKTFYKNDSSEFLLNGFMEAAMFMTDTDKKDNIDAVNLLSGHRCKGLEFDVVYIIGFEDGIIPHANAIDSGNRFDAIEEERRLLYVMVTRAKKYLFITSARERETKLNIVSRKVSRFARELIIQNE